MFQGTDIDIYFPLNLIRKVPQILIDKNIAYPIEYHYFFYLWAKPTFKSILRMETYLFWIVPIASLLALASHGISTNK